ncbi:MAG: hypothetical protein WB424_11500 [Terracidiphilus sp.]
MFKANLGWWYASRSRCCHDLELLVMSQRAFRFIALLLCWEFMTALIMPHFLSAEKPKAISGAEVDRSVIAALAHQGVTQPKVISRIDLTEPFGAVTQWTFVAIQDDGHQMDDFEDHGPIFLCLVKAASPDCTQHFYPQVRSEMPWFDTPYHLFGSSIVYLKQNKSSPLLFLRVCGAVSGDGDCDIATALYTYDKNNDRFIRVFLNLTGRNNNQETRFVESGPLQGDVIVNYPTENAPYTYWIEVYRAGDSGQYSQILRYRSLTGYSDGNPLAVADSEMPEILQRLGLWKPGDPLPVPAHMPQGCRHLFMRLGEEWCK